MQALVKSCCSRLPRYTREVDPRRILPPVSGLGRPHSALLSVQVAARCQVFALGNVTVFKPGVLTQPHLNHST